MSDELKAGDHAIDESSSRPHVIHVLEVLPRRDERADVVLRAVVCPVEYKGAAAGFAPEPFQVPAYLCRPPANRAAIDCQWEGQDV